MSDYWLLDDRLPPDLNWIEPGFALGGRPYPAQRPAVQELGIQTIVTVETPLPDEVAIWAALGIETLVLPTRDYVAIPFERFEAVSEAVLSRLSVQRSVLLHCLSGVNRAPTFALAILCLRDRVPVDVALSRLRSVRPRVDPTPEELTSLRGWLAETGRAEP